MTGSSGINVYKNMYYDLVSKVADVVETLEAAMKAAEKEYITSDYIDNDEENEAEI